jgi:hypothetical protein
LRFETIQTVWCYFLFFSLSHVRILFYSKYERVDDTLRLANNSMDVHSTFGIGEGNLNTHIKNLNQSQVTDKLTIT